jgi:hypothetical protein
MSDMKAKIGNKRKNKYTGLHENLKFFPNVVAHT